jgi:hypothetical protein
MVSAASVAIGHGVRPQVVEGLEPTLEDRHHRRISLRVDAPNPPTAIVDIEIGGELGVGRLQL